MEPTRGVIYICMMPEAVGKQERNDQAQILRIYQTAEVKRLPAMKGQGAVCVEVDVEEYRATLKGKPGFLFTVTKDGADLGACIDVNPAPKAETLPFEVFA